MLQPGIFSSKNPSFYPKIIYQLIKKKIYQRKGYQYNDLFDVHFIIDVVFFRAGTQKQYKANVATILFMTLISCLSHNFASGINNFLNS